MNYELLNIIEHEIKKKEYELKALKNQRDKVTDLDTYVQEVQVTNVQLIELERIIGIYKSRKVPIKVDKDEKPNAKDVFRISVGQEEEDEISFLNSLNLEEFLIRSERVYVVMDMIETKYHEQFIKTYPYEFIFNVMDTEEFKNYLKIRYGVEFRMDMEYYLR